MPPKETCGKPREMSSHCFTNFNVKMIQNPFIIHSLASSPKRAWWKYYMLLFIKCIMQYFGNFSNVLKISVLEYCISIWISVLNHFSFLRMSLKKQPCWARFIFILLNLWAVHVILKSFPLNIVFWQCCYFLTEITSLLCFSLFIFHYHPNFITLFTVMC